MEEQTFQVERGLKRFFFGSALCLMHFSTSGLRLLSTTYRVLGVVMSALRV